jgi:hypothetical protein
MLVAKHTFYDARDIGNIIQLCAKEACVLLILCVCLICDKNVSIIAAFIITYLISERRSQASDALTLLP